MSPLSLSSLVCNRNPKAAPCSSQMTTPLPHRGVLISLLSLPPFVLDGAHEAPLSSRSRLLAFRRAPRDPPWSLYTHNSPSPPPSLPPPLGRLPRDPRPSVACVRRRRRGQVAARRASCPEDRRLERVAAAEHLPHRSGQRGPDEDGVGLLGQTCSFAASVSSSLSLSLSLSLASCLALSADGRGGGTSSPPSRGPQPTPRPRTPRPRRPRG